MGSVKLTNYSRDSIAKRAVEHSFAAQVAALEAEADALGREAYDLLYPATELKLVSKLPENWFRRDACLRFNVGGRDIVLNVSSGLPVPYGPKGSSGGYGCNRLGVIEPGELCDRIQAHAVAFEKHREDRRAAERATRQMLGAVSTVGKLEEVWPEGKPFYANYLDKSVPQLPAIRAQEINQMLGLAA